LGIARKPLGTLEGKHPAEKKPGKIKDQIVKPG